MTGNLAFGEETAPLQIELPARSESVALARHAVAEYAQRHGTDGGRVALAVSEAVTSALVHGSREPVMIRVTARLNGNALLISVADDGAEIRPQLGDDRLGVGLALIATVTDSMSLESSTADGTRVVMRFR